MIGPIISYVRSLFGFERGLHKHKVTALIVDGPLIHQVPIMNLTSSGMWTATIHGVTFTYVYDRSKITTLRTGENKTKRVIIYDIKDAAPTGHAAVEVERHMDTLGITTRLDKEWIEFLRATSMAASRKDNFVQRMTDHIDSQTDTRMTVAHKARFRDVIQKIESEKLHDTVITLSELLDHRIISPTTDDYSGLIPSIESHPKAVIKKIKNQPYRAKNDWTNLAAIILAFVLLGGVTVWLLGEYGIINKMSFTISTIPAECSAETLTNRYPDLVDLAVAIQTREVMCEKLPPIITSQLDSLTNDDKELIKWIINNPSEPQPSIMPAPEDMTIDDVTITPEEAARQQAEQEAAEQARLQAEQNAAEELRLQEEAAALEAQARIEREAARVAEFERVAMCSDYDHIKSTYQTSFNIAVGLYTGELDCSIDELPEQYRDTVAAQDQRTIEDYVESGYDILNP